MFCIFTILTRSSRSIDRPRGSFVVARRCPQRLAAQTLAGVLLLGLVLTPALAQMPPAAAPDASPSAPTAPAATAPAATPAVPPALDLQPFAWLHGCWDGKVNGREFREEWLPLRGDMMIGMSQTVMQGKTQDFEYVRLESRPEGVFYVNVPSGKKETSFRFAGKTQDSGHEVFTFENPGSEFPQKIVYRHGTEGWLYASAEGQLNGAARNVIYPMRHVDCASGELLHQ